MKLFKYLKEYKLIILILLLLLGIRAYGELGLPKYTSNIVNIGIQQSGIEDSVFSKISKSTKSELELFMSEDEVKVMENSYALVSNDENMYELKKISVDERKKLNSILEEIILSLEFSKKQSDFDINKLKVGIENKIISKETLIDKRKEGISKLGNSKDLMLKNIGVNFVKEEYKKIGINIDDLRMNYIYKIGIIMAGVTMVGALAAILATFVSNYVATNVAKGLREKIYKKVLSFSKVDYDDFSTSSLITRSTNDISQIQGIVGFILFVLFYSPIMAVGGIVQVLLTNVSMAWIIGLGVLILVIIMVTLMLIALPKFKIMQKLIDNVNLVSRELLSGIYVIRVFKKEKYEEKRFDGVNKKLRNTQLFTNRVMAILFPSITLIMNGVALLIIWVGGYNVDAGNLQIGDMMAFISYAMQIIMSILMLTSLVMYMPRAMASAERIDEVLNKNISVKERKETKDYKLQNVNGVIEFKDVTFTFPGATEPTLENISFKTKLYKTTAIIGSTGAGKSTLLNLIPRYYDLKTGEGQILIDGVDIKDISLYKLREILGIVPQKGILFSGTIEENLKFGNENITEEKMIEATKLANAYDFIMEKEQGFNYEISQGGTNVSGGQKQRLSIARALAKNPKIILFDDSFSALDYKTDLKIRKELETQKITKIIVAQRISTVMNADQILVLDEGKLVGIGKHKELLKTCDTYREIAESQLNEEELKKGGE